MSVSRNIEDSLPRKRIDPRNVLGAVFRGGGSPCASYASALQRLNDVEGFSFENMEYAAGASAGAFAALGICAGLSGLAIFEKLSRIDFSRIEDSGSMPAAFFRLATQQSYCKGEYLYDQILQFLQEVTGREDPENITFRDWFEAGYKDLHIIASECYIIGDEGCCLPRVYCLDHTADASIAAAIHASVAVPYYFPPVEIKNENNHYTKAKASGLDTILNIDGCIAGDPGPSIFDYPKYIPGTEEYQRCKAMRAAKEFHSPEMADFEQPNPLFDHGKRRHNPHVLAFELRQPDNLIKKPLTGHHPIYLAQAIINGVMRRQQNESMRLNRYRTISIDKLVPLTKFNLSKEEQMAMMQAGSSAITEYYQIQHIKDEFPYMKYIEMNIALKQKQTILQYKWLLWFNPFARSASNTPHDEVSVNNAERGLARL